MHDYSQGYQSEELVGALQDRVHSELGKARTPKVGRVDKMQQTGQNVYVVYSQGTWEGNPIEEILGVAGDKEGVIDILKTDRVSFGLHKRMCIELRPLHFGEKAETHSATPRVSAQSTLREEIGHPEVIISHGARVV
jgi:hypothetical protein